MFSLSLFHNIKMHLQGLFPLFSLRDSYHGIKPLDPEKLSVFQTVREITGTMRKVKSLLKGIPDWE